MKKTHLFYFVKKINIIIFALNILIYTIKRYKNIMVSRYNNYYNTKPIEFVIKESVNS